MDLPEKLDHFYSMVKVWFDEIDRDLESNLNADSIQSQKDLIVQYMKENDLENYKLIFDEPFRIKFLSFCGCRPDRQTSKSEFYKFSRFKSGKVTLKTYWSVLDKNFKNFYLQYKRNSPLTNFADVERPFKLLAFYFNKLF